MPPAERIKPSLRRTVEGYGKKIWELYHRLGPMGKAAVWGVVVFYIIAISIVIIFHPDQLLQYVYDYAQQIKEYRFGWLFLGIALVVTSFPPVFGYGTAVTLCGFAYGVAGWFIAAPGALLGAALCFITLRRPMFRERVKKWTRRTKKWQAMEVVIKAKGMPLIVMIRLCPLPWWSSNTFFASVESVSFSQYMIATMVILPKLLLHCFVGSRMAAMSDGKQREKMDLPTKVINIGSIVFGSVIAGVTGWYLWKMIEEHMRSVPEAAGALDLDETRAPLLEGDEDEEMEIGRPSGNRDEPIFAVEDEEDEVNTTSGRNGRTSSV